MAWRLLDQAEPSRGAWNMALDDALFRAAEEGRSRVPVVRLYAWAPPCLSLGFHQAFREACDEAFCREAGIDVVRRPTGGKAVLHADEVTYSVASPLNAPPFDGLDLRGTYEGIAGGLLAALLSLGLPARLEERAQTLSPKGGQPCFLVASEKEIVVGGRKVAGSAQRRGRRAFLQHGAVPLRMDYGLLAGAAGRGREEAEAFRASFAGLSDLRPEITPAALRAALREGFAAAFGSRPVEGEPAPAERAEARRLERIRYGTKTWTETGKDLEDRPGCAATAFGDGAAHESPAREA